MNKSNSIVNNSANIIRNQQKSILDLQIEVNKVVQASEIANRQLFNISQLNESLKAENDKLKVENEKLKGCVFCGTDKDITNFKNKIVCKKCIKDMNR